VTDRRSTWQYVAICAVAVFGMAASAAAPALAASPSAHPALKANHSHASAVPVRCKTRNKAAGTLKYSDWQFPDTLNPYQTQASVSFETIYSMLDGLIQFNQKGAPYPVLMTNLPTVKNGGVLNGGKTIVTHLKPGLRWSNGQEITNADVKFGWKLAMDKNSGPECLGTCDVISSISTSGKYDVTFRLKNVYAPFVTNALSFTPFMVWPVSWPGGWAKGDVAGAVQKLWQDTTFNFESSTFPTDGAYQVATWVKDDRVILHPMKYYGTMTCGAHVQTLIFAFYASKASLIAAAASHQTDATTDYTLADIPELAKHTDAYALHNDPGYLIEHLTFNLDKTYNGNANPLSELKMRQALALSLDKEGMIRSALSMSKSQADGVMAWTPLILTKKLVQPFADKALQGQWDPIAKKYFTNTGFGTALKDAQTLISQTSCKSGCTLDFYTTSGNAVRQAQAAVIANSFKKIGVNLTLNFVPASKLFGGWTDGGILQRGTFQVSMYADVGYPDPQGFFNTQQSNYIDREKTVHSTVNANVAGIHDKSFDQAFNKAPSSFDPKVRQHWYNIWQVGLNHQAYWIPLFYRGTIATADSKIGNFESNPTNASDEWNTFSWVAKGHA
jgi:peptide/nickel transport system substrate-binding protein